MPCGVVLLELASCSRQMVEERWSLELRRSEPTASLHVLSTAPVLKLEFGGDLGTCGGGGYPLLRRWLGASEEMEGLLRLSTVPGGRKVVRRARSSVSTSLAGRGGEGRSGWMEVFRFCLVLLAVLFSGVSASAGHGGEGSVVCWSSGAAVGGPGRRCVGGKMGGAREQVLWPCPFNEPDSVARRRMDLAVVYIMWWRLLPGGKWYGDAGGG